MFDNMREDEWFTLDSIQEVNNDERLYCIAVDSEDRQFLIGKTGVPTHNTEEGKEEDALKGEASMIIGSIARLGRAAGVHLVIATQRPDATIITGETKSNLGVRINCGRTDSNASSMILGTGEGARVKSNPRGRLYLRIFGSGNHGQGLFAEPSWIDDYLAQQGLNADGSPISQPASKLASLTDFSELAEADLDSREGVDNNAAIERIRDEEARRGPVEDFANPVEDADDDWGFLDEEDEDADDIAADSTITNAPSSATLDRPELTNGAGKDDKFHRPEEDWDSELEELIKQNFD